MSRNDVTEKIITAKVSKGITWESVAKKAKRVDLIVKTQQTALADLPYYPLWWGEAATAINDTFTIDEFGSYTFLSPWAGRVLTKDA